MSETSKPAGKKRNAKTKTTLQKKTRFSFKMAGFFPRHHTRDLHHTSNGFFLDSFKNMNISELPRVSKSEFNFDRLQESMQIL